MILTKLILLLIKPKVKIKTSTKNKMKDINKNINQKQTWGEWGKDALNNVKSFFGVKVVQHQKTDSSGSTTTNWNKQTWG